MSLAALWIHAVAKPYCQDVLPNLPSDDGVTTWGPMPNRPVPQSAGMMSPKISVGLSPTESSWALGDPECDAGQDCKRQTGLRLVQRRHEASLEEALQTFRADFARAFEDVVPVVGHPLVGELE